MYRRFPYLYHLLSALKTGPVAGAVALRVPLALDENPGTASQEGIPSPRVGAGPCQLSHLEGPAPSGGPGSEREEQDKNQKKHPQQHHNGTPLSAVWGQKGQRLQGDGVPPLPPPSPAASPRGLTTRHVGYFGHLPEDPIHPGLGVIHLMSKGIQHAVETKMV